MKLQTRSTLMIAMMLLACFSLSAQKPADLVGTWIGEATAEGEAETNELTLVLEMKEGQLTGHMSDQFASMNEAPISEVSLENGVFAFSVSLETGSGTFTLAFKMKVEGDTMKGELEVPDMGMTGTWEATKQK